MREVNQQWRLLKREAENQKRTELLKTRKSYEDRQQYQNKPKPVNKDRRKSRGGYW